MAEKKFTAHIDIKEVGEAGTISKPTREVTDVARVVVSADTLADVAYKAKQHLELIADGA